MLFKKNVFFIFIFIKLEKFLCIKDKVEMFGIFEPSGGRSGSIVNTS